MAKNKKIISFEQLFQDDEKIVQPNHGPLHYLAIILIYFGIMLVLGSVVVNLFASSNKHVVTYDETEMLVYNVKRDINSLAFVNKEKFISVDNKDGVKNVYSYENYYFIVHEDNKIANDFIIDDDFLFKIYNEEITNWSEKNIITFYKEKSELTPNFFKVDTYYEVTAAQELSSFAGALSNFIIYIFLLPPLLYLTKKDFVTDYGEIKSRKNEWIVIILVGYLYLMIGNIASNLLTGFLSDLFKVPIEVAKNQEIIVNALNSKGAILMVISAVLLGPVVEEIVFRKAIFNIFKKDYLALIVSTVVFGAIHVIGEGSFIKILVNGLTYFIMGLAFGLIYMKNDKNIYVSIAVHILSNLIAVIGVLFLL